MQAWREIVSSEGKLTGAEGDNGAEGGVGQGFANGGHPEPHCLGSWRDTIAMRSLAVRGVIAVHIADFSGVFSIALRATAVLQAPFAGRCDPFDGVVADCAAVLL